LGQEFKNDVAQRLPSPSQAATLRRCDSERFLPSVLAYDLHYRSPTIAIRKELRWALHGIVLVVTRSTPAHGGITGEHQIRPGKNGYAVSAFFSCPLWPWTSGSQFRFLNRPFLAHWNLGRHNGHNARSVSDTALPPLYSPHSNQCTSDGWIGEEISGDAILRPSLCCSCVKRSLSGGL
jgi:hypothetical protein